ncbi:hypothetical protein BH20ACT24_BH20ACT24_04320 [soil metagenome]
MDRSSGRKTGLLTAVRSGRHSFPGHSVCDGGIVIDLGLMKGIRVDPEARTARAQAGVLLGDLDRETQAFGLAVPSGIVTHTGMAGLTLGGRHRLADAEVRAHYRSAAVGRSDHEFEFRLNLVGPVMVAGPIFWPMEESPKVLHFYRDWIADAPDELTTIVVHRKAPPLPAVPPELHGKPVVTVVCCYAGRWRKGRRSCVR